VREPVAREAASLEHRVAESPARRLLQIGAILGGGLYGDKLGFL